MKVFVAVFHGVVSYGLLYRSNIKHQKESTPVAQQDFTSNIFGLLTVKCFYKIKFIINNISNKLRGFNIVRILRKEKKIFREWSDLIK